MKKSMFLGSISLIAILYSGITGYLYYPEHTLIYNFLLIANILMFSIAVPVALLKKNNILFHISIVILFIMQVYSLISYSTNSFGEASSLYLIPFLLLISYWAGFAIIKNDKFSTYCSRAIYMLIFWIVELYSKVHLMVNPTFWWDMIEFTFVISVVFLYFSGKDKAFIYDIIIVIAFVAFIIHDFINASDPYAYYGDSIISKIYILIVIKTMLVALYFIVFYNKKIKNIFVNFKTEQDKKISKQKQVVAKLEMLAELKDKQIITDTQFEERKKVLLEEMTNVQ